jgi:divalent metal cation (Fe/Co/Zn/Cd) transporter
MLICKQGIDHLNDAISYIIDSELDSETKLQIIKNLVNLSRERKFMDYEGLKRLKDHVDNRVKKLKGK